MNMNNREAQNELCRSTETPEEVYRIALSYERGYKYAKSYGSANGEATTSGTTGGTGAFQIKTEPVGEKPRRIQKQQAARPWIVQRTSRDERGSF